MGDYENEDLYEHGDGGVCHGCGSEEVCPQCSGCRDCASKRGWSRCGECETCAPLVTRRETVLTPVGAEVWSEGPSFCRECLAEQPHLAGYLAGEPS